MKKHVHVAHIVQFAAMAAEGYPVGKLVQWVGGNRAEGNEMWVTGAPTTGWHDGMIYRVACAFIGDTPVFDGAEVYLDGQLGRLRWNNCTVVFAGVRTNLPIASWPPSEQPSLLSLTAPAAKQYEITHQIGDVSVTVRAPSAAECEQMVARLDELAESRVPDLQPPRDMTPREKEHLAQLRVMNCGRTPFQFDRRKFISSLGGIVVSNVSGILAVAVPAEMQEHAIAVLSNTRTIGVLISVNGVRVP
jgi:hypothetical protein